MRRCAFLAVPVLACVCAVPGFSAPAAPPVAKAPEAIIAELDGLFDDDKSGEVVVSPARFAAILKQKMAMLDGRAAEFRKRFPDHPLRWKLLLIEALNLPLREAAGLPPPGESARAMFERILAAADAPADVKSGAGVERLMLAAEDIEAKKLAIEEWEKWLEQHWKDFPGAEDNAALEELHAGLVREFAPARLGALLERLAAHADHAIAEMAGEKLAAMKALAELRSRPLELKFKALDGAEVDVEKLRGKVVLVDFWATWCGPCMARMPELVAAYAKLHAKGFEIIGISLDEDEAALRRVLKAKGIKWPQHFDGRGWENAIAKQFRIDAIPAMWLVNKEGMIVDTDERGDIAEKVAALLK